jgi:SAM-dependent methyltransferase
MRRQNMRQQNMRQHCPEEFVFSMLRCPQCGSTLRSSPTENRVFCNHERGPCSIDGGFPVVDGRPALVVFEHSVLEETPLLQSGGKSPVRRQKTAGWLRRAARRFLSVLRGENRIAETNCRRWLDEIRRASPQPIVLNIGGASVGAGARALNDAEDIRVLCFDVYSSSEIDFIADAHKIPLPDASIDGVWIQAVLEHVIQPEQVVAEIHRVLKPNGVVYAEIPFMQTVHEGAYDFTRFTDNGVRWLFRRFDRLESGVVLGPGSALLWSIGAVFGALLRRRNAGNAIATLLFFWVRFLDRFIAKPYGLDAACGLYFFGRKSAEALAPKDVVRGFQGVP